MALACEMLRSELEAFAEQTLQNHFDRFENRLLQGIKNEIRNLNLARSSTMPPGPMRPSPAPLGKPGTLAVPHAMPPGHMELEDADEDEFRFIGKWAETVERQSIKAPSSTSAIQHRARPRFEDTAMVEQIQASRHERQGSKTKAKAYRGPGAPPPDHEAIEPLRTYVIATEMDEIDREESSKEKKPSLVRSFTSKKSIAFTRMTIPNIFFKGVDQSGAQDDPKNALQGAGRASSKDHITVGSLETPVEVFAVPSEDEKSAEHVQGVSESENRDSLMLTSPAQMLVFDEDLNGHRASELSFEDEHRLGTKSCTCISVVVKNPFFDYSSAFLIFLNAISIGLQTDWSAENYMESVPDSHRIVDYCFCCAFTLELVLRLWVFQKNFFFCPDWKWNVFDTVLVGMQLTEEILNLFATKMQSLNMSFMRILRILRLVRIVRLFRMVRVVTELRTIVSSMAGCMKSLFATLVLLLLMIYVVGVFFTQLVSDHHANRHDQSRVHELDLYYASLSRSILSLYCAMSGGVDWENMVNPLIENISPALAVVFAFYIAFAVLAMMNVVTGVFVESALISAKEDKDIYMVNHLRALLKSTDDDGSGTITWDEFEAQLANPQMVELFRSIDVDIKEARGLFDLLDMNDLGRITTDQFVTGCLRLRGHAKSLDLSLLIHEQRRISKRIFSHVKYMESQLTYLCETVGYLDQAMHERC